MQREMIDAATNSPGQASTSFVKSCKQVALERRLASRRKRKLSPGDKFSAALGSL